MARITGALVVLVMSSMLWVAPATGGTMATGDRQGLPALRMTASYQSSSYHELSWDPACNFGLMWTFGTYHPDRANLPDGTFSMDLCIISGAPVGFGVSGTFEFTSGDVTLLGTVAGTWIPFSADGVAMDVTLTVTASRGSALPVRGTIHLVGTETGSSDPTVGTGTLTTRLRPGDRPPA